jgi:hypothetical protein
MMVSTDGTTPTLPLSASRVVALEQAVAAPLCTLPLTALFGSGTTSSVAPPPRKTLPMKCRFQFSAWHFGIFRSCSPAAACHFRR